MAVVRTDKWFSKGFQKPLQICEKLKKVFYNKSNKDIFHLLTAYGMFHEPSLNIKKQIESFVKKDIWSMVRREELKLKKRWDGPEVLIFILPATTTNRLLNQTSNGKSGLAFHDKLFLFISPKNSINEIKAVFTHEYNHVCRLTHYPRKDINYTLLDTMILEGLAENAVKEIIGKPYTAHWTDLYTMQELRDFWEELKPVCSLPIHHPKHNIYLYGSPSSPTMIGYSVGYYLVHQYMQSTQQETTEILATPSTEIAQLNSSIKRNS